MAKKRRIRKDRVILVAIVGFVVLFGGFKLIQFTAEKVSAIFSQSPLVEVKEPTEDTRPIVILDPGHGGIDGGTRKGEFIEKNITLKMAKAAGAYLEKKNVKVVYTRTDDERIDENRLTDLKMRAQMSQKHNAKYFVSIHVNDFKDSSAPSGFEVHQKNNEDKTINNQSQALAKAIATKLGVLNYSKDRGIQNGKNLSVLKFNSVPSVLIETGFINNSNDFKYLSDETKIVKYGEAIAKGMLEQLQNR